MTVTEPIAERGGAADQGPRRKLFSRQEYERMIESGIFAGQRVELIDGELIDKMGQKPPHAIAVRRIHDWLVQFLTRVGVQLPIEVSGPDGTRSNPEPDLWVLREEKPEHNRRHPLGSELVIAIEVADASAGLDLGRKATIYAASQVPEYWVLDLNRRLLVIHRESDGEQYRDIHMYSGEETVSLLNRTETVKVGDLLPEAGE